MEEGIPVVKISVEGEGSVYIVPVSELGEQQHLFDGSEPGSWYRFEFGVMTEEELNALPEFDGF